jgi:phage-related protein
VPTQAVFYRTTNGREPVHEFMLTRLATKVISVVEDQIDEMNGLADSLPPLAFPRTSHIAGGLRELRCHFGNELYRILYRRSGNLFVLLHMIRKNSRTVPTNDIELAERRWQDFRERMDAPKRRGLRPAGKDAP